MIEREVNIIQLINKISARFEINFRSTEQKAAVNAPLTHSKLNEKTTKVPEREEKTLRLNDEEEEVKTGPFFLRHTPKTNLNLTQFRAFVALLGTAQSRCVLLRMEMFSQLCDVVCMNFMLHWALTSRLWQCKWMRLLLEGSSVSPWRSLGHVEQWQLVNLEDTEIVYQAEANGFKTYFAIIAHTFMVFQVAFRWLECRIVFVIIDGKSQYQLNNFFRALGVVLLLLAF